MQRIQDAKKLCKVAEEELLKEDQEAASDLQILNTQGQDAFIAIRSDRLKKEKADKKIKDARKKSTQHYIDKQPDIVHHDHDALEAEEKRRDRIDILKAERLALDPYRWQHILIVHGVGPTQGAQMPGQSIPGQGVQMQGPNIPTQGAYMQHPDNRSTYQNIPTQGAYIRGQSMPTPGAQMPGGNMPIPGAQMPGGNMPTPGARLPG